MMRRSIRPLRALVTLFVVFCLAAAACGSGAAKVSGESAAVPVPASDLPDPFSSDGSQQHGLSLEEWGDAMGSMRPAGDEISGESAFSQINWDDLIPADASGEEIYARFEKRLGEVRYGSPEATALFQEMEAEFDRGAVNEELDGQKIRLAGFVAPLVFDEDVVTEFLLVPTFGACIHVPPPPPNQTVMVTVDRSEGLTPDEVWGAVWVEGTLAVDAAVTDLATASYTLSGSTSGVFDDF